MHTVRSSAKQVDEAQERLQQLADTLRAFVHQSDDPRGQALFETSAEVLLGLDKAFADYARKNEAAWRDETVDARRRERNGARGEDVHEIDDEYNRHDASFRRHYQLNHRDDPHDYGFYAPAYRYGYELAENNADLDWETAQVMAQRHWQEAHASGWQNVAQAVRYGWEEQRNPEALRVHHDDDYPHYRSTFESHYTEALRGSGLDFDAYEPAYRYGYNLAIDPAIRGQDWAATEPELRKYYETEYADGELVWEHYRDAAHHAWASVRGGAAV